MLTRVESGTRFLGAADDDIAESTSCCTQNLSLHLKLSVIPLDSRSPMVPSYPNPAVVQPSLCSPELGFQVCTVIARIVSYDGWQHSQCFSVSLCLQQLCLVFIGKLCHSMKAINILDSPSINCSSPLIQLRKTQSVTAKSFCFIKLLKWHHANYGTALTNGGNP